MIIKGTLIMSKENRTIRRIKVECPMTYNSIDRQDFKQATSLDVSNSGILFLANEQLQEGSLKEIRLEPTDQSIAKLNAIIQIVRVDNVEGNSKQFKIAGIIKIIK
jgi:hypothetical protein